MEQTEEVASMRWDEYFTPRDDENAEWLSAHLSSHPQVVSSLMAMALKIRELWNMSQDTRFQVTRSSDPETPEYLVVFVPGGNEDEDIERLWRLRAWRVEYDPTLATSSGILFRLDYSDERLL